MKLVTHDMSSIGSISMKKILTTSALLIMSGIIISLSGCSNKANISNVNNDYGKLTKYSTSQIKPTDKSIIDKFMDVDGRELLENVGLQLLIKFTKTLLFS